MAKNILFSKQWTQLYCKAKYGYKYIEKQINLEATWGYKNFCKAKHGYKYIEVTNMYTNILQSKVSIQIF